MSGALTPVMPDADRLVRLAFTAGLAARGRPAQVFTLWPGDWASRLPLVVARRVSGAPAPDPRGLDLPTISVTACAADRDEASVLARTCGPVLRDACLAQYRDVAAGGYLSTYLSGVEPAELRTGDRNSRQLAVKHHGVWCNRQHD